MSEKARQKMQLQVWSHGKKKAACTIAISSLIKTGLENHPDIIKAIKVIEEERRRLNNMSAFD